MMFKSTSLALACFLAIFANRALTSPHYESFTNTSTEIREGAELRSPICVSVLNGSLSEEIHLTLTSVTVTPVPFGPGHDKKLLIENPSFTLNETNDEYCFNVMAIDDSMNNNYSSIEKEIYLTNQPNQTLSDSEVLSPNILQVEILEDDVITFLEQPSDITTVIMGQGYFPCRFAETGKVATWNIVNSNGEAKNYSTTTLPPNHFFNGTGLIITNVKANQNLTTYRCYFRLNRAGLYFITSSPGRIIILTPVIFELSTVCSLEQPSDYCVGEGENVDIIISKSGYTNLTFVVTLDVNESVKGSKLPSKTNFTTTSYIFEPTRRERRVTVAITEDSVPNGLMQLYISIATPINIIGQNSLNPSMSTTPLNISILDNDCELIISINRTYYYYYVTKHTDYVGFMNYSALIEVNSNDDEYAHVCVSFFGESHGIDPNSSIHLIISEINNKSSKLYLNPRYLILNQTNQIDCVKISSTKVWNSTTISITNSSCVPINHTLELSVERSTAHNVYIQQRFSLIQERLPQCMHSMNFFNITFEPAFQPPSVSNSVSNSENVAVTVGTCTSLSIITLFTSTVIVIVSIIVLRRNWSMNRKMRSVKVTNLESELLVINPCTTELKKLSTNDEEYELTSDYNSCNSSSTKDSGIDLSSP